MSDINVKTCTFCHRELPLTEYAFSSRSKDGRQNVCKECRKKYDRERAAKLRQTERERRAKTISEGGLKFCPGCKKDLPVNYFYKCYKNADGYSHYCRACTKEKRRDLYGPTRAKKQASIKFSN